MISSATPNRCMNVAMKSATGHARAGRHLKLSSSSSSLTPSCMRVNNPPPLSLSFPHSATRPSTNTPLRHHQALQASSLTAYGKVAMHLQSRSTTVRRSRYLATLNPTQSRDSTARTLRRKEQDAARHDAPFATRRNNFASPTQPCRPLTPTSLEAGLRYDVTRFMPRGALGTNF